MLVRGMLKAQPYNPELPELSAEHFENIDVEYPSIASNYDQYEEFEEVEFL